MPSPGGAVPASAVSWSSDNEAVAAVDNGTVTAAAPGTATITAEVNGKSRPAPSQSATPVWTASPWTAPP